MKTQRNLSGIYFRQQNIDTSKWENVCFEDLEEEKQLDILNKNEVEFVKKLAVLLADTINRIGEELDIISGGEE